ncbi:hypothetical protein B0H14DRAFT_2646200 [Mycena olivaceomarginata]|nr:hypothetical protein B0H14DRAFT_2646200 [Mycena olivaceomarginata]
MRLGQTSRSYPPDTSMDEIKDELLAGWNVTWTKVKTYPIVKERADWRFHGNQNIIQDSEHLADTSPQPGSVAKKRRGSVPPKENEDPATKHPRVSGVGSNFKHKVPGPDPANSTEDFSLVCRAFGKQGGRPVNGEMKHCFNASLSSGFILWLQIQPFQLSIGTEQYVAKHFYEIGSGQDEVTMVENAVNLQFEALRLRDYKMPSGSGGYPFGWSSIACIQRCKGGVRSLIRSNTSHCLAFGASAQLLHHSLYRDNGPHGRLSTNAMGIIIFDMMTHTPDGCWGLWEEGIEKWRDQHDCNVLCKNLDLAVGDDNEDD